jgi:hypothetical protein
VGGTCGRHETGEELYKVLVGKPEGRPRCKKDGMDLREIAWESVEWIHLANSCEYGDEPPISTIRQTNIIVAFCANTTLGRKYQQ